MSDSEYVVLGGPTYRAGAYIIDKFLENQKMIQENYPSSELVLATIEKDFINDLSEALRHWDLKGKVLLYETLKPDSAVSPVWNVTCGREAIRQYTLSKTEAKYFLSIDTDMTYDPKIIHILKKEIEGYDIVVSGYPGKRRGSAIGGLGCALFTVGALQKINFRCYEFRNHRVLDESEVAQMDSFSKRLKFKNGYFLTMDHYDRDGVFGHLEPHSINVLRKISNTLLVRYILLRASMVIKYNIPSALQQLGFRFLQSKLLKRDRT